MRACVRARMRACMRVRTHACMTSCARVRCVPDAHMRALCMLACFCTCAITPAVN